MRGTFNSGALVRPDGGDAPRPDDEGKRPDDEADISETGAARGTLVAEGPSGDEQASSGTPVEPTPTLRPGRTGAASVMASDLFPPGLDGPSRTRARFAALTSSAASALSAVRRAAKRGS
jgi:hypothetical protein